MSNNYLWAVIFHFLLLLCFETALSLETSEVRITNNNNENLKKATSGSNGVSKGYQGFQGTQGYKYVTKIDASKSCALSVIDKTVKGKNNWVLRIDKPHPNVPFEHMNINSKFSGIKDPHIKLPTGAIKVAQRTVKVLNGLNKVLLPIAIAVDVIQTSVAIYNDVEKKTSRNTVETLTTIAGGWAGGYGGAVGGAAVGTMICPVLGTLIGGIVGGVTGGISGSLAVAAATKEIGDWAEYDIAVIVCEYCRKEFEWRKYVNKNPECPHCKKKSKDC